MFSYEPKNGRTMSSKYCFNAIIKIDVYAQMLRRKDVCMRGRNKVNADFADCTRFNDAIV